MKAPEAEQSDGASLKKSGESLASRLRERIRLEGRLTFRDWMEAALYDECEGYYCRSDRVPWGRAGDYRTSPESSPLFAATFAGYFASLYEELDSPSELTLLEAGAGAGHFAHGVLETLANWYPQVFRATRYLIDEVGAESRERLVKPLDPFKDKVEFIRLDELVEPFAAGIIFSNELLDAMPVHRVVMRNKKLLELCVSLDQADEFVWVECEPTTQRLTAYFEEQDVRLAEGQLAEVNLSAGDWLCRAARALGRGYIITVDYGAEANQLYDPQQRREGTLRAFAQHCIADDVLSQPGAQDITTTVNWTQLERAGEECGLETESFERQDQFLLRAGLLTQLERVNRAAQSEAEALRQRTGAREMILPGGMSESFQVLIQKRINK